MVRWYTSLGKAGRDVSPLGRQTLLYARPRKVKQGSGPARNAGNVKALRKGIKEFGHPALGG